MKLLPRGLDVTKLLVLVLYKLYQNDEYIPDIQVYGIPYTNLRNTIPKLKSS